MTETNGKSRRGFASMTPERRKEIASLGGKSVAPENRAFSKSRDLARAAGKNGGRSSKKTPTE
jgi:general stress protein YciG